VTTIRTADGALLAEGDRAFNFYDMVPGRIGRIDAHPQPDTMAGQDSSTPRAEWSNHWFDFHGDDGTRVSLDGSRICTLAQASRKGWV
jgi:hypothetical protein